MDSAFINLDNFQSAPFKLYENNNVKNDKAEKMTGTLTKNNLSKIYFSQSNIDFIQNTIISEIYRQLNQKINKQSEDELLIVMRSIYLQYSKHSNENINYQVQQLNKRVLDYCIPNVATNLKQYNQYIKDITSEKQIMDKPQFVNIKGEKTLMPKHFF